MANQVKESVAPESLAPKNQTPTLGDDASKEQADNQSFDFDLIRKYPRANKRLSLAVAAYGLHSDDEEAPSQTQFISPYGLEFKTTDEFAPGTLLKIHIAVPDYWNRKQRFVDYARIDTPDRMKVLAKVVKSEDIGKRGKKKMVTVQTIIIDEVDEQVLKTFLQEG